MTREERIQYFRDMVYCSDNLLSSCYDLSGTLLYSNAGEHAVLYHRMFMKTHALELAQARAEKQLPPAVISINLGLSWITGCEEVNGETLIHVLGPVSNFNSSLQDFQKAALPWTHQMSIEQRSHFTTLLEQLPVLNYRDISRCAIQLYHCICGQRLAAEDIAHVRTSSIPEHAQLPLSKPDHHRQYKLKNKLLANIRAGNVNSTGDLADLPQLFQGGSSLQFTGSPLQQAILQALLLGVSFMQASCAGGLGRETAQEIANQHIHDIQISRTQTDVLVACRTMYMDFVNRVHQNKLPSGLSPVIRRSCDYILCNPEEDLRTAHLAEEAGYSPYYFSHKFKEETGVSLNDFIRISRIEKAKLYLAATDLDITEIASRLHFSSRTHFTDTFRLLNAISPSQWRIQNRKNDE